MISICMNDRQQVITNVWAGASICMSGNQYVLKLFFFIIIVFFSSLKNYYFIFLVLIYFLK